MPAVPLIRTPDQRLRVFVSSTLQELAPEQALSDGAIRSAGKIDLDEGVRIALAER